jgi:glutamyl-tRNA synthetase
MTPTTIRARFAPSPTGHLHVGGARTALFNWLFCRHEGGRFAVRIEDTDVRRNIEGAEQKLLEDLRWLGLDWDEGPDVGGDLGPFRQSERRDLYDGACRRLLDSGDAYYAFDTPEELEAMRREAARAKRNFRYPRPDPLPTEADASAARADGRPVVMRFKSPATGVTVHDEILGTVSFAADDLDDFVIVKSNGWPTYHLAVVVDDAAMKITHVLRAQEHLMNTSKHVLLQRALDYAVPKYAHLPLVFNVDGSKMSKRDKHRAVRETVRNRVRQNDLSPEAGAAAAGVSPEAFARWLDKKADTEIEMGALGRLAEVVAAEMPEIDVHDFRVSGYLPEALVNFIALIGWSPGDDREKMSLAEMTAAFTIDRVTKTPGRFDREKLLALNTDWAADLPVDRLLAAFRDYLETSGSPLRSIDYDTARHVLAACKGFRTFRDVESKVAPLFAPDDEIVYDPKAVRKVLEKKEGRGWSMLERLMGIFDGIEPWTHEAIEASLTGLCESDGVKLGDVAQPIRVAVTGRTISPAIHDTLTLLGKQKTRDRIRRCLESRPRGERDGT